MAAIVNSKVSFSKRLFFVVVSENKFYFNKGLNTLHNIKTEEGEKTKKPVYFTRHWAAVASKLQALQLCD